MPRLTPRRLRAVLLDLDDTLHPERAYVESGLAAAAGWLAAETGGEAGAITAAMRATLDRDGRGRVFDTALAALSLDPGLAPLLVHLYRTHTPTLALFSDVGPALAAWRRDGVKLGVVTDGASAVQSRKAAALNLGGLVDVVVCTDDLGPGRGKPAPDGYAVALARLGVAPDQAVYVGDDPAKDFVGARALGLATVRLERRLPHPLRAPPPWPEASEADAVGSDLGGLLGGTETLVLRQAQDEGFYCDPRITDQSKPAHSRPHPELVEGRGRTRSSFWGGVA